MGALVAAGAVACLLGFGTAWLILRPLAGSRVALRGAILGIVATLLLAAAALWIAWSPTPTNPALCGSSRQFADCLSVSDYRKFLVLGTVIVTAVAVPLGASVGAFLTSRSLVKSAGGMLIGVGTVAAMLTALMTALAV